MPNELQAARLQLKADLMIKLHYIFSVRDSCVETEVPNDLRKLEADSVHPFGYWPRALHANTSVSLYDQMG